MASANGVHRCEVGRVFKEHILVQRSSVEDTEAETEGSLSASAKPRALESPLAQAPASMRARLRLGFPACEPQVLR